MKGKDTFSPTDRIFYVYCYMDPRSVGLYKYGDFFFSFLPKYIGKGTGNRMWAHMLCLNNREKSHKASWLRQLDSLNLKPVVEIISSDLTNLEALELEMECIRAVGRRDLDTGPLLNHTDGGEGMAGYRHSKESIEKWLATKRSKNGGLTWSDENRKKISERVSGSGNPMYGKTHSPERIAALKAQTGEKNPNYGHKWTDKQKKDMSEKLSGKNHPMYGKQKTEEQKRKQSTSMIGKNVGKVRTDEYKKLRSKLSSGENNGMFGKHHSPETIEKIRAKAISRKVSEETRKKLSAAGKKRRLSPETIEKIRIKATGRKRSTSYIVEIPQP